MGAFSLSSPLGILVGALLAAEGRMASGICNALGAGSVLYIASEVRQLYRHPSLCCCTLQEAVHGGQATPNKAAEAVLLSVVLFCWFCLNVFVGFVCPVCFSCFSWFAWFGLVGLFYVYLVWFVCLFGSRYQAAPSREAGESASCSLWPIAAARLWCFL